MSAQTQLKPDLQEFVRLLINDIKIEINCINIGRIVKFYEEDKTADISICFKKKVGKDILEYPLLLKCPILGNKITLPIEEGEYCLVLFNDKNMDSWFETGNPQVPYSDEKHDLNNGFAITGLNSLVNKINYDNSAICLNYSTKIKDKLEVEGQTNINSTLTTTGNIDCPSITPQNGASGVFVDTPSGKSITIENGIITQIS